MKKLLAAAMLFMLNSWSCFSADTPRAEYPRPQFEREQWINLNGIWTFVFDLESAGKEPPLATGEEFEIKHYGTFLSGKQTLGSGLHRFHRTDVVSAQHHHSIGLEWKENLPELRCRRLLRGDFYRR